MISNASFITSTKKRQQHANKVSFTEEDFMRNIFCENIELEQIPPADRNIFDSSVEDNYFAGFNQAQSSQYQWEPLPNYVQHVPNVVIDDADAIRIPSLDKNLKWSPQNPVVIIPNIGYTTLSRAVSNGEASIHGTQLSILEEVKRMTYRQKMKLAEPEALISEEEITDKDVICERGGKSNRHAGTKRYRGMIESFKPQYQSLTSKTSKTNLSRKLISTIQDNCGRFLKKDERSQKYFVLSAVETTKKVSQALREKKSLKWTEDCTSTKSPKPENKASN
jgi:hypothetical protein